MYATRILIMCSLVAGIRLMYSFITDEIVDQKHLGMTFCSFNCYSSSW